ncbi:hypothetical protein CFIMG_004163RA [Ceratocystis fimbriata CBS 114723]|uniref:Uncharacterized protein n=1 Tax=Ceratocystis fimbriata CBS 114723 TaxID=1035309 RepID=A0A2C5X2L9_9PEZI|nr:hypothetical protein CFIMG_004163RA [Ceratocystis fimbriata CBS 114723]
MTRPGLSFAISQHSKYLQTPCEKHMQTSKRMLRYLVDKRDCGLRYRRPEGWAKGQPVPIITYADASLQNEEVNGHSSWGFVVLMAETPSAPEKEIQAGLATLIMSLSQAIKSSTTSTNSDHQPKMTARLLDPTIIKSTKLTDLNWNNWSTNMIRNFKGLEEEEFLNAMDVEKSDREKAEDETEALGLIRASLDEETLDYIDGAPNAERCWTILRMRYKISTDQQHAKLIEKVFQDMEWKEGNRMFQKWLKIQNKFGKIPNFEQLLDGTTTACMTTRLIIHLWANRLPRNIATILERHLKLSQGKWTDIMYKIDDEIDSLPKNFQKTSSSSASNQTRPDQSQQRSKTKCFFYTKPGHRESECRTKKTWERRNITANMSLMDENPISEK